jgi:lipoprotein
MKFVKILVLVVVSAVAVATATSCSKESKLIGTWATKNSPIEQTVTFKKGGTGTFSASGISFDMTWTLEKNVVTVKYKMLKEVPVSLSGTFDGTKLVIGGIEFTKK